MLLQQVLTELARLTDAIEPRDGVIRDCRNQRVTTFLFGAVMLKIGQFGETPPTLPTSHKVEKTLSDMAMVF
jgi:hypothetical protein